jgi:hypothetical protein
MPSPTFSSSSHWDAPSTINENCNPDEFGMNLASAEDMDADSGVPTVNPAHERGPLSTRSTEDIAEGNSLQLNLPSNIPIPMPDTATQCWNNAVEVSHL